jgi:hypothetical protein
MRSWGLLPLTLLASLAQSQQLILPSAFPTCEAVTFAWTATTGGPYQVSFMSGQTILESLPTTNDLSAVWTVDLPPQTAFSVQWMDGAGVTM